MEQIMLGVVTFLLSISCFSVAMTNYHDQRTLQKGRLTRAYTSGGIGAHHRHSREHGRPQAWCLEQQAKAILNLIKAQREQTKIGTSLLILKACPE